MFSEGQQVRVVDTECSLHNQIVTVVRPNPKCTAEWEVLDENGGGWIVHSCRLRATSEDVRDLAHDINSAYDILKDTKSRLLRFVERSDDLNLINTRDDLGYAADCIADALRALEIRTSLPLG